MGAYKLYLKKGDNDIKSLDDWKEFASPKKEDIQWKDGRSAKELAKYMTEPKVHLPNEIEEILLELGCEQESGFTGEPEKVTRLTGKGEGRNHDLLLVQDNKWVVGIEAKADEPLGNLVSKELSKDISDNKRNRIESLYNDVYGCYTCGVDVRYQLLTATVGTLIEAKNLNASNAVLIIITFKKEGDYNPNKVQANIKDINDFVSSLGKTLGKGQYNIPGYPGIDFYIKHIEKYIK